MSAVRTMLPLVLLASACTRPSTGGVPTLDAAALVHSQGTLPRSQLTLHQEYAAANDPGLDLTVMIDDATFTVRSGDLGAAHATVEELTLLLDDIDLPPSQELPDGQRMRAQSLTLPAATVAEVLQQTPDALALRITTPLAYHASTLLDDGTLYSLGVVDTTVSSLDLRVTLDEAHLVVELDAAPAGDCWQIDGVMTVNHCTLFVESAGDLTALAN